MGVVDAGLVGDPPHATPGGFGDEVDKGADGGAQKAPVAEHNGDGHDRQGTVYTDLPQGAQWRWGWCAVIDECPEGKSRKSRKGNPEGKGLHLL